MRYLNNISNLIRKKYSNIQNALTLNVLIAILSCRLLQTRTVTHCTLIVINMLGASMLSSRLFCPTSLIPIPRS